MGFENLRILYAEDEKDLRDAMIMLVDNEVKEFHCVKDGLEAYEFYQTKKPDILLLDINMPNMSGIEVAQKIRKSDHSTRIIMITAFSDVDTLLDATELKLTKYLVKPFSSKELFDALKLAKEELLKFHTVSKKQLFLKENFAWDFDEQILTNDSQEIRLTPKEKKILNMLFINSNSTINYDNLLMEVWDDFDNYSIDTLKTMVKNIRKKLPENTIQNIYGIGYKFNHNSK